MKLNGEIFSGEFFNGVKHGYGELMKEDGTGFKGFWENDAYIGKIQREFTGVIGKKRSG